MNKYLYKSGRKTCLVLAISISVIIFLLVSSCSDDQTVYGYVITKPIENEETIWRPVMRVTFRVGNKKVITEVAGLLDEYHNCVISDKNNWQCDYEDGRGMNQFGFKDGIYWNHPGWGDDIKYVSRWNYNVIRCRWYQYESGVLKGSLECLKTYI